MNETKSTAGQGGEAERTTLTRREQFVLVAMRGLCNVTADRRVIARKAVEIADEVLAELDATPPNDRDEDDQEESERR